MSHLRFSTYDDYYVWLPVDWLRIEQIFVVYSKSFSILIFGRFSTTPFSRKFNQIFFLRKSSLLYNVSFSYCDGVTDIFTVSYCEKRSLKILLIHLTVRRTLEKRLYQRGKTKDNTDRTTDIIVVGRTLYTIRRYTIYIYILILFAFCFFHAQVSQSIAYNTGVQT